VFLKLYGAERHSLTIKLRLLDSLVVAATTEWLWLITPSQQVPIRSWHVWRD